MNLAELFVRVSADVSGIRKGMSEAERSLDKLADKAANLGQKLTLGVTTPLLALGGLSARVAADFESLTKGLEAVAGSAGAAQQQLARLREIAKLPSVDLKQATQASIAFQAIGKSAEFAERTIKGVANAVALSGGGAQEFSGVLRQMRQIASVGKLMGEELNTILENAPAMAKALKNAFGTTSAEAIRGLNLTTEEFFERLQQGMESLPQVAGGAKNSFDNFRSSVEQAAAVIGGQLLPAIIPVIEGFSRALDSMQALNPETVRLAVAFGVVAAALGPLISGLTAATKAVLFLRAASVATLATLGVGGALVLGISALAGIWTKRKLDEWSQASTAVDNFALSIQGLSREQMILATANILKRVAELEPLAEHFQFARDEIERLNGRAQELATQFNALGPAIQNGAVNPLNAVTTAADEAADALNRLDARVGFRGFDHTLGDPRIIEESNINPRAGLPGPELTPVTARGEKTASQAAEIEAVALAREAEREAIESFTTALGSLSRSAARGVQGLQSFMASVDLFRKGQGGSGLTGALNLGAGLVGGIGAVTQIGGALLDLGQQIFGQSQATRELTAAMRSNSDRLRELRLKESGFSVGQEQVEAAARFAEQFREVFKSNPFASVTKFDELLRQNGLTRDQFLKIAQEAGVQITDANGKILLPAVAQAADILGLFTVEMEKVTSSMTNVPTVFANALRRFQASTAGVAGGTVTKPTTRPPVDPATGTPRDRPTLSFTGPVTVVANDPQEFARQMEAYGAKVAMRSGYSNFALSGAG